MEPKETLSEPVGSVGEIAAWADERDALLTLVEGLLGRWNRGSLNYVAEKAKARWFADQNFGDVEA